MGFVDFATKIAAAAQAAAAKAQAQAQASAAIQAGLDAAGLDRPFKTYDTATDAGFNPATGAYGLLKTPDFWDVYNVAVKNHGAPPIDINDPNAGNSGQPVNVWTCLVADWHVIMLADGTFFFWDQRDMAKGRGSIPGQRGGGVCPWSYFATRFYTGPWSFPGATTFNPPPNWTLADELVRRYFAEPRVGKGARTILGSRSSLAAKWWETPPGFPDHPNGTVWRQWNHIRANGPPDDLRDWFLDYIDEAANPDPSQRIPFKNNATWLCDVNLRGSLNVPARNLPPPPPAHYWDARQAEPDTYPDGTVWFSELNRIGLTASRNQLGNGPRSAPPGCHWEPDDEGASSGDPSESGDNQLIYDGDLNAIVKASDLPDLTFEAHGKGGYSLGSSNHLSDVGRYWTPLYDRTTGLVAGFRTQHRPYDFGREALHVLAPAAIVVGTVLSATGIATVAGAAIAAGGKIADSAQAGSYALPEFEVGKDDHPVFANTGKGGTGMIAVDYGRPLYHGQGGGVGADKKPPLAIVAGFLALAALVYYFVARKK